MLVLSRRIGERIVIGGGIEVVVRKISGNRIRLGIAAPEGVRIIRGELAQETKPEDNRAPLARFRYGSSGPPDKAGR